MWIYLNRYTLFVILYTHTHTYICNLCLFIYICLYIYITRLGKTTDRSMKEKWKIFIRWLRRGGSKFTRKNSKQQNQQVEVFQRSLPYTGYKMVPPKSLVLRLYSKPSLPSQVAGSSTTTLSHLLLDTHLLWTNLVISSPIMLLLPWLTLPSHPPLLHGKIQPDLSLEKEKLVSELKVQLE
jgi:hypothetical protein